MVHGIICSEFSIFSSSFWIFSSLKIIVSNDHVEESDIFARHVDIVFYENESHSVTEDDDVFWYENDSKEHCQSCDYGSVYVFFNW